MNNQSTKAQSTTNTAAPIPMPTPAPILLVEELLLAELEGVLVEVGFVVIGAVCEVTGTGVVVVADVVVVTNPARSEL